MGAEKKSTGIVHDITDRKLAEKDLRERLLLAEFSEEVSTALVMRGTLRGILQACAASMVRYLDAAFARIWLLDPEENVLVLNASAGMYTHLDGPHGRVPVGKLKIGLIAEEKKPHLTNHVVDDPRISDQQWARREGIVAFAGHPLIVDDRIVGVMALFSRTPLSDLILKALASASRVIALGIERKRKEAELRMSEERYRDLFENASELIQSVDADGKFLFVNRAWKQALGYSDGEIQNLSLTDVIDPESLPHCMELFRKILEGEEGRKVETVFRRKDGRKILVEGNINCRFEHGKALATRGMFRDITERKRAEQRQVELMREIGRANQELKDFAYIVSHDLKAPLRAISSLAEWIASDHKDSLGEEGREQIVLLQGRVRRMHSLIDGVLQYSRLGRIREERTEVSFREVLDSVLQLLDPPENVTVRIETPLPSLCVEKTRIAQVFQNLISNAIKYVNRPDGEIRVGCKQRDDDFLFHIRDNGPGIDPKHFGRIFQLFQTLAPRDDVESTGVGLAVVKKIVEMYGGKVWVESSPGKGASFFFTIPKMDSGCV